MVLGDGYSLTSIAFPFNLRNVRSWDLSPVQLVPINFGEPPVCKDIGRSRAKIAVTLSKVANEKILEELLGESVEISRISNLACNDLHLVSV